MVDIMLQHFVPNKINLIRIEENASSAHKIETAQKEGLHMSQQPLPVSIHQGRQNSLVTISVRIPLMYRKVFSYESFCLEKRKEIKRRNEIFKGGTFCDSNKTYDIHRADSNSLFSNK